MLQIKTICICGGGGQCHAIAPWLTMKGYKVNILTNRPDNWNRNFKYQLPDRTIHSIKLDNISSEPKDVIQDSDVIIMTVPGYVNKSELVKIKPFLKKGAFVGGVFSSNGFFFDAQDVLGEQFPLWGFQRVPFIGKVLEYGKVGGILDYKTEFRIAVENTSKDNKEEFRNWIEKEFERPTTLLSSYLDVSLSNSNPLLHPARIYTWLKDWDGNTLKDNPLFYEQWPDDASEMYIQLDKDLHTLINSLPMSKDSLPYILDYYESTDPKSLSSKLRSIKSFKGIHMPVIKVKDGWFPDKSSRYFMEDFNCGLARYRKLAVSKGVSCPTIEKIYQWGIKFLYSLPDIK